MVSKQELWDQNEASRIDLVRIEEKIDGTQVAGDEALDRMKVLMEHLGVKYPPEPPVDPPPPPIRKMEFGASVYNYTAEWKPLCDLLGIPDLPVRRSFDSSWNLNFQAGPARMDIDVRRPATSFKFNPKDSAPVLEEKVNTYIDTVYAAYGVDGDLRDDAILPLFIGYHEPLDNIANGEFTIDEYIASMLYLHDQFDDNGLRFGACFQEWEIDNRTNLISQAMASFAEVGMEIGWDVYQRYESGLGYRPWSAYGDNIFEFLALWPGIGRQHVLELGCPENPNDAAYKFLWLSDMAGDLYAHGQFDLVCYYNHWEESKAKASNHPSFLLNSSPGVTQLWRDLAVHGVPLAIL